MKKALITGGTRGIGEAIAKVLAAAGIEVFVTGSSVDGRAPEGCSYLAADFSRLDETQSFAHSIRSMGFSILVNNAGINKIGFLSDYDPNDFLRIQQVNVTAPFLLCQAVVPQMSKQKFGRIVNVTSVFGVVSKAQRSAYSTSKYGLLGMSRALALEVAKDNVLVNCVAPGIVETDLTQQVLGEAGIAEMIQQIPIGRLARPEEIANCVKFLVSEENSYMTGQTVLVDGGFTSA